jgi:hypothetical protein
MKLTTKIGQEEARLRMLRTIKSILLSAQYSV